MQVQGQAQGTTRPVLRVFISSTAVDLLDYREKVRDAVLSLKSLPIAMETFSAQSGQPASECMRMAAEADAVICIVAHRYGYVPSRELGGDDERSITWLEVDAARAAGKQVFAFLVDPKATWTAVKEQDRLTTEPPEKLQEIGKAVQDLKKFKSFLENEYMRGTFANEHELAKKVAITLANFVPQTGYRPTATARVWKPLFCHALQPAQHFRGRDTMLADLKNWVQTPVTPDRVVSLVAAGGTGKTALVNQALHDGALSDRAGTFVWSFYEDPRTDAFLREAYLYFTGEKDTPTGGMLERLQIALSGDVPHLLVLDGLERVQSEGDHRRRGELEDLQLKRLIRALAGGVGSARVLMTSRFSMVDLETYTGAGHRAIVLDDLELAVALNVLRAWGVKGDDAVLIRMLEPLNINGSYHALSVAVLGSYVGNFAGGDPRRVPEFSLQDAQEADPKARRLNNILEQYAKALTVVERDLLARLSLFPRGVKVEILGWIVQSGGKVAGAMIGLADRQLVMHLERLKGLGLVFRYETGLGAIYSSHPFLREFFRNLLNANPESVHESVRARLAPGLERQPKACPRDPAVLDQYELLMEQTLLAGNVQEALDLYKYGIGGFENLGRALGENGRGLRMLERFVPQDGFTRIEANLSLNDQSWIVNDLGLFSGDLGDLIRARRAFAHSRLLDVRAFDQIGEAITVRNLVMLEIGAARFNSALEYADSAVLLNTESLSESDLLKSLVARAISNFALGKISAAVADFQQAAELEEEGSYTSRGICEAECKLLCGDRSGARGQIQMIHKAAQRNDLNGIVCICNALLARLLLPDNPVLASQHLHDARTFANNSGDVVLQLQCFYAACALRQYLGDYPQAIAEAEAGILLADTCNLGKYSIDLRLALAETLLAVGDARKALQNARNALDRSGAPDCAYAWGKSDGLHFCGIAHLRLGERELALQRLTAALELRETLGHGRLEETRRALELCRA